MPNAETLERFIGTTMHTELADQRWEGERIAEEAFFGDPAQRAPKKPA